MRDPDYRDAKRAGLFGKAGPWTQYLPRMLQMRARSWNFRDNLADVLKGFSVREEVVDERPEPIQMIDAPPLESTASAASDPLLKATETF